MAEQNPQDGEGRTRVSLSELIALRARAMRIRLPKQASQSTRAGQQASRLFGRGMDYAESRVYQPGDDVRRLDWRLTARSGKLHTKLFEEEREASALILLDTHRSMDFGTRVRYKSVQAARAAALAAWLSVRAGERIGLMTFGTDAITLRPQASVKGALRICGAIADSRYAMAPSEEVLSQALQRVARLQHGANRLLIVSDGISCDDDTRRHLSLLKQHVSVRILIVADALELNTPPAGRYVLAYDGAFHDANLHSARQRNVFQQSVGAGQQRLSALAQSLNVPWRRIDTVVDPFEAVRSLMSDPGRAR